ncbi:glycosyltransferase family 4 protein [Neobacillus mesonae]|nr:glycosyltransferase family 4 protein [Neobacillus mesonae]
MKKILLISNMYPNEDNPFYGIFVKNSLDILADANYDIKKIVLYKENKKAKKAVNYLIYYLKIMFNLLFQNYNCVYVHYASHNALPIIIAKKLKGKLLIYTNVHGSDVVPETKIQQRLQPLVQKLLDCSSKIIVPSDYFKNYISSQFRQNHGKLFVFPSGGINPDVFFMETNTKNTTQESVIGYVGRIDKDKGWEDLLEAFNTLDVNIKVKLVIVGNGKQYNSMLQMIENHSRKRDIILYDMLKQQELRKIYNELDLFVFPTKRKGESLGLVGIEAMACGTPVLGSKIAGLQSYIEDGSNGLFFTPGNVTELKNKMIEFLNMSSSERETMKQEALNTARLFERDSVKNQLLYAFK